mgnify:CR=1 FL=1
MIAIGSDHAGVKQKKELIEFLEAKGEEVCDLGCFSEESVDYPVYSKKVVKEILEGRCDRGILICGTGIGVCIAANKVKGVYAALLNNVYQAERAQLSNNANVITLGAQVTGIELGKCLVREYLANTYDSASRSGPKVQAIVEYEAAN